MLTGVFKHTSNVCYKYIPCNFSILGIVNRLYMSLLRAEGKGTVKLSQNDISNLMYFQILSFLIQKSGGK